MCIPLSFLADCNLTVCVFYVNVNYDACVKVVAYAFSTITSCLSFFLPLKVDKYLTAILDDLSQNLNSHLWRNREARSVPLSLLQW